MNAGRDLYTGLVVLFSGVTYGLAGVLFSDKILSFFGIHLKRYKGRAARTEQSFDVGHSGSKLGERRRNKFSE